MPTFTYRARDESGRLVRGMLEAESQVILADRLKKMGYLVTRVEQTRALLPKAIAFAWERNVSEEVLLLTSIQLANLVDAGVPLTTSLKTLASQTRHLSLRRALDSIRLRLEAGASLSQSLSHHPTVFPSSMARLVAVGEASGKLPTVLTRFAVSLEKDLALRRALKGALLYPSLLMIAATFLVLFLVTFVVPQFSGVFAKAGIPLPIATVILKAIGETIQSRWWLLILLLLVACSGLAFLTRLAPVRLTLDGWMLKIPLAGPLILQATVARLARTLATLVGSGVPILTSLETAQNVMGNRVIHQEIGRVALGVERGERIAAALSVGSVFPPDAIQMIRVGEESGRLDEMLEKVADFYELRVGYAIKQMTTLLEPMLLVAMGGVVAFLLASLVLPMFDMVKVLQAGGLR